MKTPAVPKGNSVETDELGCLFVLCLTLICKFFWSLGSNLGLDLI